MMFKSEVKVCHHVILISYFKPREWTELSENDRDLTLNGHRSILLEKYPR